MKFVITGALGHIGSKLIRHIPTVYPGAQITMIDDMSCQRYVSLFQLPAAGRYRFIEADVCSYDLSSQLADADVVVHLAAITNAAASFEMKERVEQVNYKATTQVAAACAAAKVPLLYVSTTSVYGTQKAIVDEACSKEELQPQSPYAETKLREEEQLRRFAQESGLKFITCRFGTIFGVSPGMRFHTAVNKFCWQAVMGLGVTVWRTALHQVRPYLDLQDAVRAIMFIVEKKLFDGEVYNVLTLNATVDEILTAIKKRVPDLKIDYVDTKIMNQLSYHVARQKMEDRGFSPSGQLDSAIGETLELLGNSRSGSLL